jgi:hypothetical protein
LAKIPSHEIAGRRRITTLPQAARFIQDAGFCTLFPLKGVALPSLYFAASHHAPAKWDAFALRIWDWKDELARRQRAWYGKYFNGRGSFLSLEMLAACVAVEGTAIQPEEVDRLYAEGRLTDEMRRVWAALAEHGPLPTLELRHACGFETAAGNVRFKRAMLALQRMLVVTHFGTEQETRAWASGRFELTSRAFPREAAKACGLTRARAQACIAAKYTEWHPHAAPVQIARLYGWPVEEARAALGRLGPPVPR